MQRIARLIEVCESFGPYCLIGGLAVNCYVEPVYTLDVHVVVIARNLTHVKESLEWHGFRIDEHPYSMNVAKGESQLHAQFSTDERYQAFLSRSKEADVLGTRVKVASLEDVTQMNSTWFGSLRRTRTSSGCTRRTSRS